MASIRRFAAAAVASAGIAAGAVVAAPTPAYAYPQNCTARYDPGRSAYSYCANGSGSHRVVARCVVSGSTVTRYGPWVGTASRSYYYCNAVGASYQLQGD
ncbi:MAG TPA: hypothetical protein VES42_21780 [Pilimelia sp.]|nr:hypothetical protein [Pilimelia sp.]